MANRAAAEKAVTKTAESTESQTGYEPEKVSPAPARLRKDSNQTAKTAIAPLTITFVAGSLAIDAETTTETFETEPFSEEAATFQIHIVYGRYWSTRQTTKANAREAT